MIKYYKRTIQTAVLMFISATILFNVSSCDSKPPRKPALTKQSILQAMDLERKRAATAELIMGW